MEDEEHNTVVTENPDGTFAADRFRRLAKAWPEYATELLAKADEAENHKTAA